jgi:hypothetical protein
MRITILARSVLLAAPLALAASPALAQSGPPNDSNVHLGGMLNPHAGEKAAAPPVTAPPAAWPRLDPGAIVCATHEDLVRHAAMMQGEKVAAPDCRQLNQTVAIKILSRTGPGATEVQFDGSGQTGWTDAWLPANPPLSSVPVSTR